MSAAAGGLRPRPDRRELLLVALLPAVALAGAATSVLSAGFGPAKVLWVVAAGIGAAVALSSLRRAALVLVLALAFPFRTQLVLGVEVHTTHLLLVVVALLGLVELTLGRRRAPGRVLAGFALIAAGAAVASLAGPDPTASLARGAAGLALPMLAVLAIAASFDPERDVPRLTLAWAAALAGASAIALAQQAGVAPQALFPMWEDSRVVGLFLHPNILGSYLATSILVLLGVAAWSWRSTPLAGPVLGLPILLGVAALLATQSRGALVALGAGTALLTVVLGARRQGGAVLGVAAALALAGGVALPQVPASERAQIAERFAQLNQPGAETGRRGVYVQALEVARAHPFTGVGPFEFRSMIARRATVPGLERGLGHAHNVLLEGWLSLGPLGLAGLVWLWVAGAIGFARATARRPDPMVAGLAAGGLAALFSLAVHGMFDVVFWQVEMLVILLLLAALGVVLGNGEAQRHGPSRR